MSNRTKSTQPEEIMVVNTASGDECRIAILCDNHLEELYTERYATATNVGNIYKGRVTNVESAIQAAFVDYGEGQSGFLHISDLHPRYFPGKEKTERVGKRIPRRERPLIQDALKRGNEVLVQVLKEGIGTKGPTLTSYLSIPGRMLVAMPDMDRVGVSRKVEDDEARRDARKVLDTIDLPEGFGFILRTAGLGKNKTELKRDVAYVMRLWKVMEKRIKNKKAPCELYTESDLLIRTIRDVLRPSISAIVVDTESAYERVSAFLKVIAPRSAPKVIRYWKPVPIFHAFDIERQIDLIHAREVPLPSGGALVIDQTEALVAIDVNSGRSRGAKDSETNAYNTNCEAVDEIARQLRLRDLGGLLVHDLIDMRLHKNRRAIEERFNENLKRDRAKSTTLRISEFGVLEMTRQRMRPSMRKSHFVECPHCDGRGEIRSPEQVCADAMRMIAYLIHFDRVSRVEVVCSGRVASVMLSNKRRELVALEEQSGKAVQVRVSEAIASDHVDYYAYDARNADINIDRLPSPKTPGVKALEQDDSKARKAEKHQVKSGRSNERTAPEVFDEDGPADAAALAVTGDFDQMDAEAPKSKKKRSKRGGRRRGGARKKPEQAKGEETQETPAPKPNEPAQKPGPNVRVFALAKQLGVESRDIIAKCSDELSIEVKNHMSSVSEADAIRIRRCIEGGGESESKPGRSRRRRGRRGGRGRRRSNGNGQPAPTDGTQAEAPATSESQAGGEAKPSKKRKRGGRRRKSPDQQPVSETAVTENGQGEPQEEKPRSSRRRGKRGGRRRRSGAKQAAESNTN